MLCPIQVAHILPMTGNYQAVVTEYTRSERAHRPCKPVRSLIHLVYILIGGVLSQLRVIPAVGGSSLPRLSYCVSISMLGQARTSSRGGIERHIILSFGLWRRHAGSFPEYPSENSELSVQYRCP